LFQILSQQPQTAKCVLRVCELASSLGNPALAHVAYTVLNLCPPDTLILNTLYALFSDCDTSDSNTPPVQPLPTVESVFHNSSATHVLYNLEVYL
jgi:hypothetical protein